MEKLYSALYRWIVLCIHYFTFLIFIHFTNQITLRKSPTQRLKFTFKCCSIKRQINIPVWIHLGDKGWRKDGKTFIRCWTIALKFWDEFNANFFLLYFLSYRLIKIWHLYLKNEYKNNRVVHLRLLFTYLYQDLLNIKKHLALVLKKICLCSFLCCFLCSFLGWEFCMAKSKDY